MLHPTVGHKGAIAPLRPILRAQNTKSNTKNSTRAHSSTAFCATCNTFNKALKVAKWSLCAFLPRAMGANKVDRKRRHLVHMTFTWPGSRGGWDVLPASHNLLAHRPENTQKWQTSFIDGGRWCKTMLKVTERGFKTYGAILKLHVLRALLSTCFLIPRTHLGLVKAFLIMHR